MNTTTTRSYTILDLLSTSVPEGQQAKVTTDNDLYGMTVIKRGGTLVNVRNNEHLVLTGELLKTKFRLVSNEKEVSLHHFLLAYQAGKKLKVAVGEKHRFIEKQEEELPAEIKAFLDKLKNPFFETRAVGTMDVMTFEELTKGKFYILN